MDQEVVKKSGLSLGMKIFLGFMLAGVICLLIFCLTCGSVLLMLGIGEGTAIKAFHDKLDRQEQPK